MNLSDALSRYHSSRKFGSARELADFLARPNVFSRPRRLYFDEVENANVWSFYLVDRNLHQTFEDCVTEAFPSCPYAVWTSEPGGGPGGFRGTFPISETTTRYVKPVPTAGDTMVYAVESLRVDREWAVLGFLGYRHALGGSLHPKPSVIALWRRVFVAYRAQRREVSQIPAPFAELLRVRQASDIE